MNSSTALRQATKKLVSRVALSAVFCASPLLAQQVTTDYDHNADFSKYHTFSIHHLQTSNPLNEQRLREDLTTSLTARGLQILPQGGDLEVTAVGSRDNKQEYNTFYEGLDGGGFGWGGRGFGRFGNRFGGGLGEDATANTTVINIPTGTLVIDVYSGSDQQLVFRGMANDSLSSKEDKNSKKLEQAVDKIFKSFPLKASR